MAEPRRPDDRVGLVRVREHCLFTWVEPSDGSSRYVEARLGHCHACIAELRRRGERVVVARGSTPDGVAR